MMMMYENQTTVRQTTASTTPVSLPTTPKFVKKFQSNFRPLDLRKITLYGSQAHSVEEASTGCSSASASFSQSSTSNSSQENSPKNRRFASASFHSNSHDSFMLKRQSSQTRLRESLLSSLLLSPRAKEIEFTVPQTLSPLTPTFGRKGINSGESSPGSLSGSRSETEPSNSRANTPSPIFFRSSAIDISGASCLGGLNPELYKSQPEAEDDDESEYPANHFGRAWFALEYETTTERLLVTLIKARNLPESRNNGGLSSCNPFVRVALFPDERRTLQSKPKKMTRHPQFNETFGFQISRSALNERSLKLFFYDVDDVTKKHSIIGYINQPLKDIDWSFGKQVFKEDLLREIGELSPRISEISVSLCYNGNISRLTVTVFEAKGIKTKESASGLYAKICLTQNTKVIKTKKTDLTMLLGCRATFNESFNFKLGPEMLDTASISIQIIYAQPGYNKGQGQDQVAGRIVLGSFMFARGKGLEHWTEMLSKQKEQVQYWHSISE